MNLDLADQFLLLSRFGQSDLVHDLRCRDVALIFERRELVAFGKASLAQEFALSVSTNCWLLAKLCYFFINNYIFNSGVSAGTLCISRFAHFFLLL